MDEQNQSSSCCGGEEKCCCCFGNWHKKHVWMKISLIIVFFLAFVAIAKVSYFERDDRQPENFNVSAQGKVFAKPDVATFTAGVTTEPQRTVSVAVKMNTEKMNAVIKKIKDLGVEDKDIQTSNYSISPQYNWDSGQQRLIGYGVHNQVTVKVRNLDKVDDIIQGVTDAGANQVGNVSFTIDDQDALKAQARAEAIEKAQAKAQEIAKESGLKLGKLVNVSESYDVPTPYPLYGIGGGPMEKSMDVAVAPQVETGQQQITVDVLLTYRVK